MCSTGAILNTQNPLYIGMQGCCDDKLGYFKGRIDDVSNEIRVSPLFMNNTVWHSVALYISVTGDTMNVKHSNRNK